MTDQIEYTRQREFFDPSKLDSSVTIVGCGGIGSFTALALAKLGIQRFNLIDMDTVEPHNQPNQMFAPSHNGNSKVDMTADLIRGYNPMSDVSLFMSSFQDCSTFPLSPVVIAALDSMSARAELWQKVRMKLGCGLFLDGRLAGQKIVLYAVNPCNPVDIEGYEATLYSDADAIDDSCTARSIIDVGFGVASLITRATRMHFKGEGDIPNITYLNQETLDLQKGAWLL